jgi:quercetin dioxygenase-like cupin family protein
VYGHGLPATQELLIRALERVVPHWGYVIKGKMTARYADRDEVFEAGDAFYTPPGHVPVTNEPGTEFVSFSPSEELRTAEAVMMKNMQAMQGGSTP